MNIFDQNIVNISESIDKNISLLADDERGVLSQNILANARNLLEAISLRIYSEIDDTIMHYNYNDIGKANEYVASRGELSCIYKFHQLLQRSVSHYTPNEDNAIRLMMKYYEYFLRIKSFVKDKFDLDILNNIEDFPLNKDESLKEYYEKIALKVESINESSEKLKDRFYIQKTKPIYVNNRVYYEITLTPADDYPSKFNRFIAFSKKPVPSYYAIKVSFVDEEIEILKRKMPIKIINDFEVAIRGAELNHFADIFGEHSKIGCNSIEYQLIMKYLTEYDISLVDIIDMNEKRYTQLKSEVLLKSNTNHIFTFLDKAKEISDNKKTGTNIIRYLLLKMRNIVIKSQLQDVSNNWISELHLKNGCLPFEQMPFVSSLINHNPRHFDVLECIGEQNRDCELLASKIRKNTEEEHQLYTPISELEEPFSSNLEKNISEFNSKVIDRHKRFRSLIVDKGSIYINGYEKDTIEIINWLISSVGEGIKGYENSVLSWLEEKPSPVDSAEKRKILEKLFTDANLALIYGAAGTGKTTLIKHISTFFSRSQKLFLANTNPALENLKRNIKDVNSNFATIASFTTSTKKYNQIYDIVVIDECSTVSNSDMIKIINRIDPKMLILVGDIYQIESIKFGNWFSLAQYFLPKNTVYELTTPYRTKKNSLIQFWNKIRNLEEGITEFIDKHDISSPPNETIFERKDEDEIILCLNYDGLYGINNVNRFLQSDNPNPSVEWGIWKYKVGDPVIFNESNMFYPVLYNNLKGWIKGIVKTEDKIQFDVEIDIALNEMDILSLPLQLLDCETKGRSLIRFSIDNFNDDDENEKKINQVMPFQIAYAISIHKAQGLEYNSVKLVITNEIEEMITHNIFYTAITRAREKLKIYWTPETQQSVLSKLKLAFNRRDANILSKKFGLTPVKKI